MVVLLDFICAAENGIYAKIPIPYSSSQHSSRCSSSRRVERVARFGQFNTLLVGQEGSMELKWTSIIISATSSSARHPQHPSVFFQFLWPLLGKIAILQKILHLLFSHDMFRQLVSCSRGGLFKTEETFLQTKTVEIFWPQKVKVGVKRFDKNMVLKNWTPMGFLLHGAVRPSLSPSY